MKPSKFEYFAPETVDDALTLMSEHGDDARFLAGGQSRVPMMNFRVAAPAALIDLNGIPSLRGIELDASGRLRIGAMTRTRALETEKIVGRHNPLLQAATAHIAHVQIRNRGTIGGSLAHADPAAELPGIVLACDALIEITGAAGRRTVAAQDFFDGIFATALDDGEMLTAVTFPPWPAKRRWSFMEISRREGDFAMVGIATWFDIGEAGLIAAAGLAAIGAGDTPLRLSAAESVLVGQSPGPALFEAAAKAASSDVMPGSDIHASATYRREAGAVLVERTLAEAWGRAA